jgi:glycosyltransferase involved in cell wall biosynthesis
VDGAFGVKAPRVLVLGSVLSQEAGGVRRHNAELLPRAAQHLAELGGSLSILLGREGLPWELPSGITRIPSSIPAQPVWARALAERAFLRSPRARSFDLVHTAHLPTPPGGALPFTWLIHDLRKLDARFSSAPMRWLARQMLAQALREARAVATVSSAVRSELCQHFGVDTSRVQLIANAADHLSALPRAPAPDAPMVHIGHLEPRKNFELLLAALHHDQELPRLEWYGSAKARYAHDFQARVRRLGLEHRARFCGPFEDRQLPAILSRAAVAVFPAWLEGFSIGVLEAIQARCPVAVSDIAVHREWVPNSAQRFAPNDAQGCARAIHTALRAPLLPQPAGRWEDSARALVQLWQQALP